MKIFLMIGGIVIIALLSLLIVQMNGDKNMYEHEFMNIDKMTEDSVFNESF